MSARVGWKRPGRLAAACTITAAIAALESCAATRPAPAPAATAMPSGPPRVLGRVLDARDGSGIANANVILLGTRIGVMCDEGGRFALTLPDTGAVVLRTSFLGYATRTDTVRAVAGGRDTVTITCTPKY